MGLVKRSQCFSCTIHILISQQLRMSQERGHFKHSISLPPAALFRFSTITFNSHVIYLSKEHCLKEGHPNLEGNGPLTLSLLLEAVRGTVAEMEKYDISRCRPGLCRRHTEIEYRPRKGR